MIKNWYEFNENLKREFILIKNNLTEEELNIGCELSSQIFHEELGIDKNEIYEELYNKTDGNLSSIAINKNNNEIIGSILCKKTTIEEIIEEYNEDDPQIEYFEDIEKYNNMNVLEGIALTVKEEHRNSFVVFKLLNSILKFNYDFIVIQQFESLKSNINYLNKGAKKLCKITTPKYDESIIFYIYEFKNKKV